MKAYKKLEKVKFTRGNYIAWWGSDNDQRTEDRAQSSLSEIILLTIVHKSKYLIRFLYVSV